jgi:poly(glycerol-phosphate) alpha-glucosyltransferase
MAGDRGERAVPLPRGRHFALTWSIPDDFGGMTSALLRRSRAFVRLGGVAVDVLTLDARPDYPSVEARLRAAGELVDGMRLVNLWDWLRDAPLDAADSVDLSGFDPLRGTGHAEGERDGRVLTRTRTAADGGVLQIDHYREDGTLVASDRRDTAERGRPGGRSVVLCGADGAPVRSFASAWALYRWWLDALRRREPSYIIVDSKTVARFALTYRRKRAVLVHVVHNSHLQGDGGLRESRREVFENLDRFDCVVVLTEHQRRDIESRFGEQPGLTVIPNSCALPTSPGPTDREGGVALASLTSRKRVDHAMRAATAAGATLDVFGSGDPTPFRALETDRVRVRGYSPNAREALVDASFVLLAGRSEGFPLVLVEAMAAGCIPIAYDVKYGPASVIRDGRNGFLVPSGDQDALADAIRRFQSLSSRRVAAMRWSARRTATAYSDEAVTRQWARALRAAEHRKAVRWRQDTLVATSNR